MEHQLISCYAQLEQQKASSVHEEDHQPTESPPGGIVVAEEQPNKPADPVDDSNFETSPTPVGDDISDFDLAQQRFKASWSFEGPKNKGPKRRTRRSGGSHIPVKPFPPPKSKMPSSPSVRMEVVMERPSIWSDVGLILLFLGVVCVLL
jgi:hypothetical protein